MAWNVSDQFPEWGDNGERPADNFSYQDGDFVNEKHLDYLWSSLHTFEDEVRAALDDIDSNADGIVDEADTANLYKGNDIDTDGDGTVDDADNATATYKGTDLDENYVNTEGSGYIANGDAGVLYVDSLAASETIRVYHASFLGGADAAPTGTSMRVVTLDGAGDGTSRTTVISGDGTLKAGLVGSPLASWQNTTGSTQTIAVVLDNGHFGTGSGSSEQLNGSVKARIE